MLNDQYIAILHQYCECRGIKYYDVQMELVDHMANAIEEMQEDNPTLKFQELLAKVEAQFGENEFREIALSKREVIKKKYWDLYKQVFLGYFTFPKICLLIFFYVALYILKEYVSIIIIQTSLPLFFVSIYNFIQFINSKKKLGISFGYNIYDSKFPILGLQMTKWFYTKVFIIGFGFLILPQLTRLFHWQIINLNSYLLFYPLVIVALLSGVDLQYKIIFKIKQHYSKAFY